MIASWAEFTDFLTALSKFAWPIIVAVLLWKLFPAIKRVVESRAFTVKVGDVEVSVQQATDEDRQLYAGLAKRMSELESRQSGLVGQLESGMTAAFLVPPAGGAWVPEATGYTEGASLTLRVTSPEEATQPKQVKRLLWIGPPTTVSELAVIAEQGVQVERRARYVDAQALLEGGERCDVIVARWHPFQGGLVELSLAQDELEERVRWLDSHAPFVFYERPENAVGDKRGRARQLGARGIAVDLPGLDAELRRLGLTLFRPID
jgi:hypothetical protein